MQTVGLGLGAMGFWFFIAAVVVAGIWYDLRKKQTSEETLRHLIDSDKDLDPELINKILSTADSNENLGRDLKVGGIVLLFIAPGLTVMGAFLDILDVMMGVSALILCISGGLLVASKIISKDK